jgi:hypothetical protein
VVRIGWPLPLLGSKSVGRSTDQLSFACVIAYCQIESIDRTNDDASA